MNNWSIHGSRIQKEIKEYMSDKDLEDIFRRNAWRHFLTVFRLVIFNTLLVILAVIYKSPLVWIPAGLFQGFNILAFITLLHEAVHLAIFDKPRIKGHYLMGLLYSLPSAISPSQFTRWHLDHHRELGTDDLDPKRAYLTPKVIKRWYKLLYITPALFVIYAVASKRAAKDYPGELKKKIKLERLLVYSFHLVIVISLLYFFNFYLLFRIYIFPLFFCFPLAFTINRLGQHYNIDPSVPAKWGTRIDGGPVVNFLQLNSNYHLEHHYLPRVPFYNLPRLNRLLRPYFEKLNHKSKTYRSLIWNWIVLNKTPHTRWD